MCRDMAQGKRWFNIMEYTSSNLKVTFLNSYINDDDDNNNNTHNRLQSCLKIVPRASHNEFSSIVQNNLEYLVDQKIRTLQTKLYNANVTNYSQT